jgi:hypothetical protein
MTTKESCLYRGYEIVPRRQWAGWCTSVYATRADIPIFARSALCILSPSWQDAVEAAKKRIDQVLS